MKHPEAQFLHERNNQLHTTPEVEATVDYLRAHGESIPNEPAEKIHAHLGFLAHREYVNDGILTGDETSINRQVEAHVIKVEDVPESYFNLQRRIAREQGHGDIHITDEMREQMIEAIQSDQRASLHTWVEYLGGDDGSYPDWFKHYTWNSVTKLGDFDKEKQEFGRRSKGTTSAYPDLNREALAYVFDVVNKSRVQGETVDGGAHDEKLQKLLQSANFGKLYAHAVLEVTPDSPEARKDIRGSWTKFEQTDDPRTARRLAGSLQGHGTGWCTAGESTAETQLKGGDFYVYYTRDEDGKDTVPRIAIRMQSNEVIEVRGVNPSQELEPVMTDIVAEKLEALPGGEAYIQKAEDMKRLTAIEKLITENPQVELSEDDLRFLYEIDRKIQNFGYDKDPRIEELRALRDKRADIATIFSCLPEQVSFTEKEALSGNIVYHYGGLYLESLTSAEGLKLPEHIGGGLSLNSLTSAEGLKLPGHVGFLNLNSLTSAEGLKLPEHVGSDLYLDSLTSAEGLKLPEHIGGWILLNSLTSAEGLKFPEHVGFLSLDSLTSAEGLKLPGHVGGGGLSLNSLTSAEGLKLPGHVGGWIYLDSLTTTDLEKLQQKYPNLLIMEE